MAIANIDISHRIVIVGSTGDGKTTLALKLLAHVCEEKKIPAVIINPGAEDVLYEKFGPPRMNIDPTWPDYQHITPPVTADPKNYGKLFGEIVLHGNNATYIDELALVGDGNRYSLFLKYLYQMGRRRNCFTIGVTQRPVDIPPFVLKMADHVFVGDVFGTDLERVEKHTQQKFGQAIQEKQQYEFLYWSKLLREPPKVVRLP